MLGKIEGKKRRGQQRMRWLDSITESLNMSMSKIWEMVEGGGAWQAAVHGIRVRHDLANEQQLIHTQQQGRILKHYVRSERKKPLTKEYIHVIPFIWSSNMGKTDLEKKSEWLILGKPGKDCLGRGMRELSRVMVMFSVLKGVWVAQGYAFIWALLMKHMRFVYFIVMHNLPQKKRHINKYWNPVNDKLAEVSDSFIHQKMLLRCE